MPSSSWAEAVNRGRKEGWPEPWLEGWLEGWLIGWREGWLEGALAYSRAFCVELTRECHPTLADRLVPLIEACSDVKRLRQWGVQATRLPDAEFLRLVTEQAGSTSRPVGRSRNPHPSPGSKAKGTK